MAVRKRLTIIVSIIVSLIVVVFVGFHSHLRMDSLESMLHINSKRVQKTNNEVTITIRKQPITQSITLTGRIAPGRIENIPAPFNSTIKKILFSYNEPVSAESVLLELDTSEIQTQLWDAESAYLQAKKEYRKVLNWENSSEVQSSRQQLEAAREELNSAQRKTRETKMLYEKGIVSRNEYESTVETLHSRQRALGTAQANLKATLEKGDEDDVERAHLQLESAAEKRDSLQRRISLSIVRAPFDGVIIMPTTVTDTGSATAQSKKLALGSSVNSGESLVATADLSSYTVETKVDEIEVGKLKAGQEATITGEAFPGIKLKGVVSRISQEAEQSQGADNLAEFKLWVSISQLSNTQREQLRLGMTAHMTILTYQNDNAIILPPSAVKGVPGNSWVMVKGRDGGGPAQVSVKTGITTLEGVEILNGLEVGDVVIMQ